MSCTSVTTPVVGWLLWNLLQGSLSNIRFSVLSTDGTGIRSKGTLVFILTEPAQLRLSCSVRLFRVTHFKKKNEKHLHWAQGWKCVAQWTVASGSGRAAQKVADRANRFLPAGSEKVTCNRCKYKRSVMSKNARCFIVTFANQWMNLAIWTKCKDGSKNSGGYLIGFLIVFLMASVADVKLVPIWGLKKKPFPHCTHSWSLFLDPRFQSNDFAHVTDKMLQHVWPSVYQHSQFFPLLKERLRSCLLWGIRGHKQGQLICWGCCFYS